MKDEEVLIYNGSKKIRKTSYSIFTNGNIEVTGPITKPGLRIPNKLAKWLILPQNKEDEQIKVTATITIKQHKNEIIFQNSEMVIFNNNFGTYIFPIEENVKIIFVEKTLVTCTFQISQNNLTNHYNQANSIIKKTNFDQIQKEEILLSSGNGKTYYEIYKVKEQIFIKHRGEIDSYGRFLLSNELRRFFKNWFTNHIFVVNYKEGKFFVNSIVHQRKKSKKITKILQFQHYGSSKEVEIIITNSDLEFNKETLMDLNLKRKLVDAGYKISAFNSNYRIENEHKDVLFEKRVKKLLSCCFNTELKKSLILSEVKIKPDLSQDVETYQEHMCVDVVIPIINPELKESSLLLMEIKTGNSKGKIIQEVEHDMARLLYLKSKLGNQNIIPVVVFNHDIKINNSITTKQFGKHAKVILIGKSEFQTIETNQIILLDRINEFTMENKTREKRAIFENPNIEITGHRISNNQGSEFEKYVGNILENENQKVISNALIRCYGKDFEIDHLAVKNEEVTVVSCKDRSNWNSTTLNEEIKHYLINLLFRKNILGTQKGRLFVKTKNGMLDKII